MKNISGWLYNALFPLKLNHQAGLANDHKTFLYVTVSKLFAHLRKKTRTKKQTNKQTKLRILFFFWSPIMSMCMLNSGCTFLMHLLFEVLHVLLSKVPQILKSGGCLSSTNSTNTTYHAIILANILGFVACCGGGSKYCTLVMLCYDDTVPWRVTRDVSEIQYQWHHT